jgi:hypothetical protein
MIINPRNPAQKPLISKDGIKVVIKNNKPIFIIIVNNPKVIKIKGRARIETMGLTKLLIIPNNKPA